MSKPSWMDPIWDYLVEGTLLSDPKEASKLRVRSVRFTVHRGTLYKRGFSTPILKCVGKEDASYILKEVQEGICGNHIGAWCHAPNPGPTRLANPNRFRGVKPYTGTPYFFFFFLSKLNLYLWYSNNFCNNQQSFTFTKILPPEWYPLKFIHIY